MTQLPELVGWRAVILHRQDESMGRMVRQLNRLGLSVQVQWEPLDLGRTPADIVFVDADQGWCGLLPWEEEPAPLPVVALLQSEAPGRVAWALGQGAGAILSKPVVASAIYPVMVLAVCVHLERIANAERRALQDERIRMRPLVHGAVMTIMSRHGLDEDTAYRRLRRAAMGRRITMEQAAGEWLAGIVPLPEAG
ncbi:MULTISPECIES: ANTAR domain-containing protein [Rhodomicrobium]|uniref:ANTAR domain-containing response regulator n=1 Tax=Rhodomicrobium TaxID=1068 RepID=UPI000B4BC903|nr:MULTISPECIES: ANTAR domain-containing protein [Rhodomicrobium]